MFRKDICGIHRGIILRGFGDHQISGLQQSETLISTPLQQGSMNQSTTKQLMQANAISVGAWTGALERVEMVKLIQLWWSRKCFLLVVFLRSFFEMKYIRSSKCNEDKIIYHNHGSICSQNSWCTEYLIKISLYHANVFVLEPMQGPRLVCLIQLAGFFPIPHLGKKYKKWYAKG